MKRLPKLVQADKRGQIVIPKEVRQALNIDETTGFYVYVIPGEGILLKQVEPEPLDTANITQALEKNAKKLDIKHKNIEEMKDNYTHDKGGLEPL